MTRAVLPLAGLLLATAAQAQQVPNPMARDAANAQTATSFNFGTGLYPQYAPATTTTAMTTSGLATITVASPVGIVVGDVISVTSPNFISGVQATYVTNIAGSTLTIEPPATSTQTNASVTFGIDRHVAGKTVLTDILGVRKGYFGEASRGHSSWAAQHFPGMDYPSLHTVFATSEAGGYAGMFATRNSDATGPSGHNVIAVGTLVDHDGDVWRGSWNQYYEARLTSSVGGNHIQTESTVVNQAWAALATDPYLLNGTNLAINLRLDCGLSPPVASLECSSPLHITNNGTTGLPTAYKSGIVIGDKSITPDGGGLASAVQFPEKYSIDWYYPNASPPWPENTPGTKAWRLYSSATPAGAGGTSTINLGDQGVVTQVAAGNSPAYRLMANASSNAVSLGLQYGANAVLDLTAGVPFFIIQNGVTHLVASGGVTQVTGLAVPAMATSCTGGIPGTLWNDAGTVKVCP